MQRLTLIHDTNGSIGLIRNELYSLKRRLALSDADGLERLPKAIENIEKACKNLIDTIDLWYTEDKVKEDEISNTV